MKSNPHLLYRPDIDGLRAIAVVAVVAFHAFPIALPGGFVGVDIFFVISGYLISSMIFKALASGDFSFADFYARRVRRIFPPLLAVIAVSLALGWSLLLPVEYALLAKHAVAGLGFSANVVLWQEAGYFDTEAALKPLLHLWSLGVEEQFYLLWPFVVVLAWRSGQRFWWVIAALALGGFAVNIFLVGTAPVAGYFLLPARAWELLAGAAIAWRVQRHGPWLAPGSAGANSLGMLGLVLIALSVTVIEKHFAFPGWWAVLPVAGAVCLIIAGEEALVNRKVLGHRLMVAVGLISFPLYLWHWPLLSFVRIVDGEAAPVLHLASALLLAVVLAALSYRFLETPIRRKGGGRSVAALIAVSFVLAAMAANVYVRDGLNFRLKGNEAKNDARVLEWGDELRASDDCRPFVGQGLRGGCLIANPEVPPNAVIVGDSHANHYYWGLSKALSEEGMNLMQLSGGGCVPLFGMVIHKDDGQYLDHCRQLVSSAIEYIVRSPEISTVFLGGRWMAYASGRELRDPPGHVPEDEILLPDRPETPQLGRAEVFSIALEETLRRLTVAGKRVIFLHAVPELPFNARECIAWAPNRFINRVPRPDCQVSREIMEGRAKEFRPLIDAVLAKYPEVGVFDPVQVMCDEQACRGRRDGQLLYRDDDHLSYGGSLWLGKQAKPVLTALLRR